MRNILLGLVLLLPLGAFCQDIKLDTDKASVDFIFLADNTKGTLSNVETVITLNWSDLAHSNVKGSVQVSTLNTGNSGRDKHLKSADFFDIEKYPVMKFESNAIKKEGAMYSGKGALTIKGVTKAVTFIIDASETEIVFYTEIFASDFGVGVKKEREKNKVTVEVHVPLK